MGVKHEYHRLNGVDTHLLTWGGVFDRNDSDVVVCISGNPGLPEFYEEFGNELHNSLQLPICVIGHAGHEEVSDTNSNILKGQEHKFNLQGQLEHKVQLIKMIDPTRRLHLIGHSIGAWMVMKLLDDHDEIKSRTTTVQFLFPTLQRMAETNNGIVVNKILRNAHSLVLCFIAIVSALPIYVKTFLINCYLKITSLPAHYCGRILKYINPRVIEKVLFLAYDEMDTVKTINHNAINKIKQLVNVIYSDRDGWAPLSQIEDLGIYKPHITLQPVTYAHAFVLRSSETVADMVSQFIRKRIP